MTVSPTPPTASAYPPIEDHGIIGNMHTAALIGTDGTMDWLCYPRFDSPAVFCSILDHDKGGHFKVSPLGEDITYKQFYWPETNILVTRFLSTSIFSEFRPVNGGFLRFLRWRTRQDSNL